MSDPETRQPGIWPEAELPRPPETPPEASPPEPQREPRLQPINRNQLCWHAVDVQRLVGPDPLVRAIWELVGRLDLSRYTRTVEGGGHRCEPRS